MIDQHALLLDRNYIALSVVTARKAIKLIVKGKAEAVQGFKNKVSSIGVKVVGGEFCVPTILRLLVSIPWRAHEDRIRFSRKNIYMRDNEECQYCGTKVSRGSCTIDHVIPKSRGGETNYNNCVLCCKECNNFKANKTPSEAGIKLIKKPKRPSFFILYKFHSNNHPDEWKDYVIGLNDEN